MEFKNKIKKLSSFNIAKDYIVLHVRRGDYVNSKSTSRFHGNLNNNYFLDGVNFIRKKYGICLFYYFQMIINGLMII